MNARALLLRRLLPLPLLLALLGAIAGSLGTAAAPLPAAAAGIEPGTANATAVDLDATYDVDIAVRYGDRALRLDSTATVTNTTTGADRPARAEHGGRETRAHVAGPRQRRRTSCRGDGVGPDDRRSPRRDPRRPARTTSVRVIFHATLRPDTSGSDWFFSRAGGIIDLYRVVPWVSLRHPFGRSNHGDPFVTADESPGHPEAHHRPSDDRRDQRPSHVNLERRPRPDVRRRERARHPARPVAVLPRDALDARRNGDPGLYGPRRSARRPDGRGAPVHPRDRRAPRRVSVAAIHRRRVARRLSDGRAGHDLDPARRSNSRGCPTSSRTRRPTSGRRDSSATINGPTRSPTKPWPTWSPDTW